jgi:hypothetical protein
VAGVHVDELDDRELASQRDRDRLVFQQFFLTRDDCAGERRAGPALQRTPVEQRTARAARTRSGSSSAIARTTAPSSSPRGAPACGDAPRVVARPAIVFADAPTVTDRVRARRSRALRELNGEGTTVLIITTIATRRGPAPADRAARRTGGGAVSSRLLPADLLRVGAVGLRTRRLRAVLSALGIAIGIASMVAVLGLSESSRAGLLHQLDRLGTNLLTAAPGQTLGGDDATLPESTPGVLRHLGGVQRVDSVRSLDASPPQRPDRSRRDRRHRVDAADPGSLQTLGGSMVRGRFLNAATTATRSVVLGAAAAQQLGIDSPGQLVYIAGRWWTVLGSRPRRARSRVRPRGADGLRRGGARAGADRSASTGFTCAPTRRSSRGCTISALGRQPRASRGGRRQPPVGCARQRARPTTR